MLWEQYLVSWCLMCFWDTLDLPRDCETDPRAVAFSPADVPRASRAAWRIAFLGSCSCQRSSRLLRVKWALLQWWFTCLCDEGPDVCAVIIRSSSISRAQSRLLDNLRCHRQKHCRDQIYSGVYSFTTLLTVTSSGSTTESTSFMFSHDDQWSVNGVSY